MSGHRHTWVAILGSILIFQIASFGFTTNLPEANPQGPSITDMISVDTIAVYSMDVQDQLGNTHSDIFYSFLGHEPKIPKPVNADLDWKWWTLDGIDVAFSPIPNQSTGDDREPSVAFSREGFVLAVWVNER